MSPIPKLVVDKVLAAAVTIGLFNLGNAVGAWLSGKLSVHVVNPSR